MAARPRGKSNGIRVVSRAQRHHIVAVMTTEAATVHHHIFDTAIGPCGVAWTARGLVGVQLPEKDGAATERRLAAKAASAGAAEPPPSVAAVVADIKRYLAGEPVDFSNVAVDLSNLDPFRQRLYETMRSLPWGRTTTYGELARQLGSTDWEGARDVGEAMGRNPVPVVIPCHRVLAAGGKLGGFSAHGGAKTKAKLLALEGVHLDGGPRLPGL
jgi:methylated-DNA-[protein]-cysteine S-methyltransferase